MHQYLGISNNISAEYVQVVRDKMAVAVVGLVGHTFPADHLLLPHAYPHARRLNLSIT